MLFSLSYAGAGSIVPENATGGPVASSPLPS